MTSRLLRASPCEAAGVAAMGVFVLAWSAVLVTRAIHRRSHRL